MNEKIIHIAKKIREGGKNVVFTGAGISTESGIPDYRSLKIPLIQMLTMEFP